MTVSSTYTPLVYNGNGTTTAFPVTWPFFTGTLVVTAISSTGVETVKTITTHYSVSGGTDSNGLPATGTVTMLSAPASGTQLRITRTTPRVQATTWTENDPFPQKTVEAMADRLMLIAQETGSGGGDPSNPVTGDALTLNTEGATDYWDGESHPMRNLSDPTDDTDAVTKGYADTNYGADAAAAAAASAAAAATSESNAATSESNAATSESNAATSESNAATSETNAATSAASALSAVGWSFTYSTTTSMADPGTGAVRFNNATIASATAIAFDITTADSGNPDIRAWMLTWDDSTNTALTGTLTFRKKGAGQQYAIFSVTAVTDNTGWVQVTAALVAGSPTWSDGDILIVAFARTGDATGDVVGPSSATDEAIARFNTTTGKLLQNSTVTISDSGDITVAAPGGFWEDVGSGVAISRLDRVFVGAATENDGKVTNTALDWLETLRDATTNNTQLAVLSKIGQIAMLGGSRTSDFGAISEGCIGVSAWAINDNSTHIQSAYAIYAECRRSVGAGTTHLMEGDVVNFGDLVESNPYTSSSTGITTGAWIASGGGAVGAQTASVGLAITSNGADFKRGILIECDSIDGTDGVSGLGNAIAMARGHTIDWFYAGDNLGFRVYSAIDASGDVQSLVADSNGVSISNNSGIKNFRVATVSGSVSGSVLVVPSTSAAPEIQAEGSATDVDLGLRAKGSGSVWALDSQWQLRDNSDPTKKAVFEASGISAGTTRTLTIPNASGTLALLGANTFTAKQTITGSSSYFEALELKSTSDDANGGPYFMFTRDSASPAASDVGGTMIWRFRDSAGNLFNAAAIDALLIDPTNGSEDAGLRITTSVGGENNNAVVTLYAGLQVGSPTGGDKGLGTINVAGDIYKNNTAYTNPDYVFEKEYTGKIERFADRDGAAQYQGRMPLEDLRDYTRSSLRLPGISDAPMGAFERGDKILEKLEELTLYILDLHERLRQLEGR